MVRVASESAFPPQSRADALTAGPLCPRGIQSPVDTNSPGGSDPSYQLALYVLHTHRPYILIHFYPLLSTWRVFVVVVLMYVY